MTNIIQRVILTCSKLHSRIKWYSIYALSQVLSFHSLSPDYFQLTENLKHIIKYNVHLHVLIHHNIVNTS